MSRLGSKFLKRIRLSDSKLQSDGGNFSVNEENKMTTTTPKNPIKSATIWGALLSIAGLAGNFFGFQVPKEEITSIITWFGANWDSILILWGSVQSIIGRFKADQPVSLRS